MGTRRTTGSARTTESPPSADKVAPRRRAPSVPSVPSASADSTSGATTTTTAITVSEEARRMMIAQAAYLRAERRGFTPDSEEEDWLAAEAEVDALLRAGNGRPPQ